MNKIIFLFPLLATLLACAGCAQFTGGRATENVSDLRPFSQYAGKTLITQRPVYVGYDKDEDDYFILLPSLGTVKPVQGALILPAGSKVTVHKFYEEKQWVHENIYVRISTTMDGKPCEISCMVGSRETVPGTKDVSKYYVIQRMMWDGPEVPQKRYFPEDKSEF